MEFTCIECETLYDDTDGDTDERMCNKCLDIIYDESLERKSKEQVKSVMGKVDELIDLVTVERRNPDIRRSSTKHYPDWDMKKKKYLKVKVPHIHRRGYIIVEKNETKRK